MAGARGYVAGVEHLGADRRDSSFADEQAGALLTPTLAFLMYKEAQRLDPPDEAAHRQTASGLGPTTAGLLRWWRGRLGH